MSHGRDAFRPDATVGGVDRGKVLGLVFENAEVNFRI